MLFCAGLLTAGGAPPRVLNCGKLLDAGARGYIENARGVVMDGKVVAAGSAGQVAAPAGAAEVDLSKGVCLPGLFADVIAVEGDPR